MNFKQAYNYITSDQKFPAEKTAAPTPAERLENFKLFLQILGNPENKIPHYIHVTGTSGKGSTSLMLESILLNKVKKVGLMTSPHLTNITERWRVGGRQMSEKEFVKIITQIKNKINDFKKISPYRLTFFDLTTAIGLIYFAEKKVNWAVVEVGCGGRYDSTNVIPHKDAAVITNVGLDHTELLGKTKRKITYEKSGIIKKGCKVFTAEKNKNLLPIILRECKKNKTSLTKTVDAKILHQTTNGTTFIYRNKKYRLNVLGEHQINNASLAISVANSLGLGYGQIKNGLANVRLPVRLEIISRKPLIILDGAHNADKVKATVQTVKKLMVDEHIARVHLLVGFSANKAPNTVGELTKLRPATLACAKQTINPTRLAMDLQKIRAKFGGGNTTTRSFANPKKALVWAKKQLLSRDLLLITGSMFLAGELRPYFRTKKAQD